MTAGIKNWINWLRDWTSAFFHSLKKGDRGGVGEYVPEVGAKKVPVWTNEWRLLAYPLPSPEKFFVCVCLPDGKQHQYSAGTRAVTMGLSSVHWQSWYSLQPSDMVEKDWKKCPTIISVNTLMII